MLILNDISQVPAGCIPLKDVVCNKNERAALRMAIHAGRVKGYKIAASFADLHFGPIYVDKTESEKYLHDYRNPEPEPQPEPKAKRSPLQELPEHHLVSIERVLLRIEALLEEHITKPQTKSDEHPVDLAS